MFASAGSAGTRQWFHPYVASVKVKASLPRWQATEPVPKVSEDSMMGSGGMFTSSS